MAGAIVRGSVERQAPNPQKKPRLGRVDTIDILRGTFMVLIVITHAVANGYDGALGWASRPVSLLFAFSTPGFTMVSGVLLGYFAVVRTDMSGIFVKYRERGLQLLITTHALIAAALYFPFTNGDVEFTEFFIKRWYITDTLAVIFIFFAPGAIRLSVRARLILTGVLLVAGTFIRAGFFPESDALLAIKELFFGTWGDRKVLYDAYPIVPLTAMFLVGTVLGDYYARARQSDSLRAFCRRMLVWGAPLLVLSGVMIGVWLICKQGIIESQLLQDAFFPLRSFTLYPIYLAGFMALFAFWIWRRELTGGKLTLIERDFVAQGRTSLFTYVVQYIVVQTLPYIFGLWGTLDAVGLVLLSIFGISVVHHAALIWIKLSDKPPVVSKKK